MHRQFFLASAGLWFILGLACSDDTTSNYDAGRDAAPLRDGPRRDTATPDAGAADSGGNADAAPAADGASSDAVSVDGSTTDASSLDGATADASVPDGGAVDGAASDAAAPDASTPDSATPDSTTADSGTTADSMVADALPDGVKFEIENHCILSGGQEVPPVTSTGQGGAQVTLNYMNDPNSINVDLDFSGLGTITAAHLHVGAAGNNGPIMFTVASGNISSPHTITLKNTDFQPSTAVATFAEAKDAFAIGEVYLNVHTTAVPSGEIRGQCGEATVEAHLRGSQKVPAVTTTATASAKVTPAETQDGFSVTITTAIANTVSAHLYYGAPGQNGTKIFDVNPTGYIFLEQGDLTPVAGKVTTIQHAIDAGFSGMTYLEIVTATHSGGEIRGQVGPVYLKATLSGGAEVPPVTTTASGSATIAINGVQDGFEVNIPFSNLNSITAAHIHVAPAGSNGPVIFPLASGSFSSPLVEERNASNLTTAGGVADFGDALSAMIGNATYINIHTTTNPGGELRGQITP